MQMKGSGRRFSFTVLIIAFTLGSITSLQLLPTMDEIEYSQEGYFNISKSDRTRSIWNGGPVVFYEGRPNHRVRSENPNNVTPQELLAWKQVLRDYRGYLKDRDIQYSLLGISPLNGTIVYYMCDLTEEKVELFVDTMKYYVPMGVIVLSNACIVGVDSKPLKSETQFNVTIGLNEYVFESQDTAQLIIRNRDSHEITFGSDYIIQKLVDGEWVKASPFPPNSAFTAILQELPAGRTITQDIKIDTLESGHYRVRKTINHERTQTELTFILEFDILPEYSYVMKLNSEPHLVKGGNCYYTIDITILNNGMSDINVKLENIRIYDITHANMTVDERGYDIAPDYEEYVLVPVNSTQSIRYVTGEVVYGSIFYVRIEFTLHIHELDKIEIVSTWLHRKLITS